MLTLKLVDTMNKILAHYKVSAFKSVAIYQQDF